MAFNKAHAKFLAEMLSEEARGVLLLITGRGEKHKDGVPEAVIAQLINLELARMDVNLMDAKPNQVLVVTNRGRKVAAQIEG